MKWGSKSSTKKKGQNSEITTCLKVHLGERVTAIG